MICSLCKINIKSLEGIWVKRYRLCSIECLLILCNIDTLKNIYVKNPRH